MRSSSAEPTPAPRPHGSTESVSISATSPPVSQVSGMSVSVAGVTATIA